MISYIDANKLAEFASNSTNGLTANDIMRFPTEDVAPVIHAKWIVGRYCSNCECDDYDYCCRQPKYCPECGAKMDAGDKEANNERI